MMKWNLEWVDLQNMERMISDCWRMTDRQLTQFAQKLRNEEDLVFAGPLGLTFLEIIEDMLAGSTDRDWSKLQKDVHMLQQLIARGQSWDEASWERQCKELTEDPDFYYYTKLGDAFVELVRERLELDLTKEQQQFRHDIRQIQRLCDSYELENEEQLARAADDVHKNSRIYFKSWIGHSFAITLQDLSLKGRKQERQGRWLANSRGLILGALVAIAVVIAGFWAALRMDWGTFGLQLKKMVGTVQSTTTMVGQNARIAISNVQQQKGGEPDSVSESGGDGTAVLSGTANLDDEHLANGAGGVDGTDKRIASVQAPASTAEQSASADAAADTEEADAKDGDEAALDIGETDTELAIAHSDIDRQPLTGTVREDDLPSVLDRYKTLVSRYPDVYGWLKIPGTEIDQPVMQNSGDDRDYFYLHHDYRGNATESGSLFVDSKSCIYPQDTNTVIYGHNMQNGHNFGILSNYENSDFYKTHKKIQFDTIYEQGTYEIVAVVKTRVLYQEERGFRYYYLFNYRDEQQFAACKDFISRNQLYDTGIRLNRSDQTIMLSTCEYSQTNGRLVVIARKI